MYSSILLSIKQEQFNRYSEAFNFFQSKSINNIIRSQKVDYVLHYRDLEILDDDTEYFKRYYSTRETSSRIQKLINYYEVNMTPPSPSLILLPSFPILETRRKKHIKLIIMQEKSQARRAEQTEEEATNPNNMILWELNDSHFSETSSEKEQNNDQDSYDSEPHYAYEEGEDELRATNASHLKDINLINLREIAESAFILDFKDLQENPLKINVIPPVVLPPPAPPVIKVSVEVQTMPMEVPVVRRPEAQVIRQAPPQMKRDGGMGALLRGQLKKQNVLLTESIEMRRQQKDKTKASTFMDYYNSQAVKAPSNILEKYIKRKK